MKEKIEEIDNDSARLKSILQKRNTDPRFSFNKELLEEIFTKSSESLADQLSIHVVQDFKNFLSLKKEWDQLIEQSPVTIFQTFDWQMLWWKHFGTNPHYELHILLIKDKGKLVGIFPLFIEATNLFRRNVYNRIRFIGSGVESDYADDMLYQQGPSDFLDAVILPEYRSSAVLTFINYLQNHAFLFNEIELVCLPENSVLKEKLDESFDRETYKLTLRKSDVCPRLESPKSLTSYMSSLNNNVRRRLVRARKKISENKISSFEGVSSLQELREGFRDLVNLHQMRWNRIGYPGLFADSRFESFLGEVCEEFGKHNRIWFKTVRVNDGKPADSKNQDLNNPSCGKRIAARMGFIFKNQIYDYLSGFDDQSSISKYRPGLALLLSMIEDAVETNCRSVEFLRGKETYKFEFTDVYSINYQLKIKYKSGMLDLGSVIFFIINFYRKLKRRAMYEILLLHIQQKQNGFPLFVYQYLKFRFGNFSRKIFRQKINQNSVN